MRFILIKKLICFRSDPASDEEMLKTLQKMLPNLPRLKNSTHFAWSEELRRSRSLLSCTQRPKLVDIKEGFVFKINKSLEVI